MSVIIGGSYYERDYESDNAVYMVILDKVKEKQNEVSD